MKTIPPQRFQIKLALHVVGPVKERTKYKNNRIFFAEKTLHLPFVPYPGMFLSMSHPRSRGLSIDVNLRIRAVEWLIETEEFLCTVDNMLISNLHSDSYEVRGLPLYQAAYDELQKHLHIFGFTITPDVSSIYKITKHADGRPFEPPCPLPPPPPPTVPWKNTSTTADAPGCNHPANE